MKKLSLMAFGLCLALATFAQPRKGLQMLDFGNYSHFTLQNGGQDFSSEAFSRNLHYGYMVSDRWMLTGTRQIAFQQPFGTDASLTQGLLSLGARLYLGPPDKAVQWFATGAAELRLRSRPFAPLEPAGLPVMWGVMLGGGVDRFLSPDVAFTVQLTGGPFWQNYGETISTGAILSLWAAPRAFLGARPSDEAWSSPLQRQNRFVSNLLVSLQAGSAGVSPVAKEGEGALSLVAHVREGWFLTDRFAVGLAAHAHADIGQVGGVDLMTRAGLSTFARYYLTARRFAFFGEVEGGFHGYFQHSDPDEEFGLWRAGLGLGLGAAYFLSDNVAVEARFGTGRHTVGGTRIDPRLRLGTPNFELGLQYFLRRGE